MVIHDFMENAFLYANFEIWDVATMADFYNGNKIITTIIEKEYKIKVPDLLQDRSLIEDSDMSIVLKTLDLIGDKYFVVFTLFDENHQELIAMKEQKIMDFGTDIENLHPDHIYIMIMDKKK
jgi:hypothetical protein